MSNGEVPSTSHLKAGMTCTIRFRHPDNWFTTTEPITGVLENMRGNLYLGCTMVRHMNGKTNARVVEVVDPTPPWPVGTRLTDGTRFAILTELTSAQKNMWIVYCGQGRDGRLWLNDAEVADWIPVEDFRPEPVDPGVRITLSDVSTSVLRDVYAGGYVQLETTFRKINAVTDALDAAIIAELDRRGVQV